MDGKERMRACLETGITPRFEWIPDTVNPVKYTWSMNGLRLNLTEDQRAAAYIRAANESEEVRIMIGADYLAALEESVS